jgi:hypothetical protein
MSLYKKHNPGVELLVSIHDPEEVSRIALGKDLGQPRTSVPHDTGKKEDTYGENIFNGRREQVLELLLGYELEYGGTERVATAAAKEFHGESCDDRSP